MAHVTEPLPGIGHIVAPNPSPLTLDGTNTWLVDGWVVDPGPADPHHLEAVATAARDRAAAAGGLGGIVLTHSHADHSDGAEALAGRLGGLPVVLPAEDGQAVGPFTAIATPGHSRDSVCLLREGVLFSGDTVLGAGSVFVAPGEGALASYLASLERLHRLELDAICPGHGPVVHDARAKLREYIDHRRARERRLVAALEEGARSRDELLDSAWDDVDFVAAPLLRVAAAATLAAHLQKLAEEGRLPSAVEAAALEPPAWAAEA